MNLRIAAAVVLRSLTYTQTEALPTYRPTASPPSYTPTSLPSTYAPSMSTTTKSTEQDTSQASPNAASNKSSTNSESALTILGVACIASFGIALFYIQARRSEGKDKICCPSEGKDKTEEKDDLSNESSPVSSRNLADLFAEAACNALTHPNNQISTPKTNKTPDTLTNDINP